MHRAARKIAATAATLALAGCLSWPGTAAAQAATSVSLGGQFGSKALLVINGTPRSLAVGSTEGGVRLLSLGSNEAVVLVDGQRLLLRLGATQLNLGGEATQGIARKVVLPMGSGGHFMSQGSINGRPVQFMVDTGATVVALSQTEADRIGLNYKNSPRGLVSTANGSVPSHSVRLASVRLGDVQVFDVDAVVMPTQMPHVLLGNSFLGRFQMRRDNDTLSLEKRP
jgi:aspartyl protease family protein